MEVDAKKRVTEMKEKVEEWKKNGNTERRKDKKEGKESRKRGYLIIWVEICFMISKWSLIPDVWVSRSSLPLCEYLSLIIY